MIGVTVYRSLKHMNSLLLKLLGFEYVNLKIIDYNLGWLVNYK